jgi:hypothetical protein
MKDGYYCKGIEEVIYMFQHFEGVVAEFGESHIAFTKYLKKPIIFFNDVNYDDWTWDDHICKNENNVYFDNRYKVEYNFIDVNTLIRKEKLKRILY